ncbi:MAG: hypothetical protein HY754_02860 [Nitrospirae bacterium]|nr:hypothetical protein [Nitrospirota bacterium]
MTLNKSQSAVILSFILLLVFISITKIADYDFWWHLKLGETIYNSGQVYSTDSFSYTFSGQPQFNAEWLADLIIYLSYRSGGLLGVNILKITIILLTFLFLFMTLKNMSRDKDTGFYAAIVTLIIVIFSIRFRLFMRPYLFSFLFVAFFLFALSLYEKNKNIKALYLLPLIEIIWANMSVGAVFGPMIFLFFVIGDVVKNKTNHRLVILLAIVIGCSLINHETYKIYSLLITIFNNPYKVTEGEHQPLSLQILWGYGIKYTLAYQILVLGSMIYFIFLKGWRNLYHLMLFLVFFTQSIMVVRMIDFFSLTAVVFFITPMERLFKIIPKPIFAKMDLINLTASIVILAAVVFSINSKIYAFGIGVKERTFPEDAIAFLEKEKINGKIFNSYSFGGYLTWRSPERRVFIDGRHRHLYGPEFYNSYFEAIKNAGAWKSAEQRWGFNYALFEYNIKSRRHFAMHLNSNPDWALVYWDNHSAVYLKRTEENRKTIDTYEYRITKPNFYDFSYLEEYLHSKTAPDAIEQINREIALNPLNQEPRLAKAFLLYYMGKSYYDEALRELKFALKLKPDLAMELSAKAYLMLEKGFINEAKKEVRSALKIDSEDAGAKNLVTKLKM